ncbi:DUF2946 domain-containing protein [Atlantibacter sp.]|uniref:DUF2946 domain-containing protein n=1 Tax=Atlantibacter sp. TaxID=1903473 RepID=UPI0028A0FC0C|nr:DUF2946 domain-containing protein [Atlantibacter sp.]
MTNGAAQSYKTKRAAWVALFAMLLILVAPLISVSLHNARASDAGPSSHSPHHHTMSMPGSMAEHVHAPGQSMVDHAEACGYCVLLSHVPGIVLVALALVYSLLQQVRRVNEPRRVDFYHSPVWIRPAPRAPPVTSAFS